jgi:hypothetical protein
VNQLQLVKDLLIAGKSKTCIARLLSLTRYRVNQLVATLIEVNMSRCRSRSKLTPYDQLINEAVDGGSSARTVWNKLRGMNHSVHYATVAKYVRKMKLAQKPQPLVLTPGRVAYVSLLKASHRRKDANYLFCMVLGYSQYSFFAAVKGLHVHDFLRSNLIAFTFFRGVPATIQLCDVPGRCLTKQYLDAYRPFLDHYGVRLERNDSRNSLYCTKLMHKVKEVVMSGFLPQDFKRFKRTVQRKYAKPFNLNIHLLTRRPIRKEFEERELPNLKPLPEHRFPLPVVTYRKTSKSGHVRYRYRQYKLPTCCGGQIIKIVEESDQVQFICQGAEIANHRLTNS